MQMSVDRRITSEVWMDVELNSVNECGQNFEIK